jgi:hypothetical protein
MKGHDHLDMTFPRRSLRHFQEQILKSGRKEEPPQIENAAKL